jgi:UTP--glucose-1-phosphate uridylyltransferase
MIRKAIIPAAGLGTRLLPVTKEMPKEMLPIFFRTKDGEIGFEPMIQAVFESLHNYGCRDYCIVVGRGKRVLEDHFTPDYEFARHLRSKSTRMADDLQGFYDRIERSTIVFMNQPRPKGFGHAVQLARAFVEDEPFIVHAGDDTILSSNSTHLRRLTDVFQRRQADAALIVEHLTNPSAYGVVTARRTQAGEYEVTDIVEKPSSPQSNLAVVAIYVFRNSIFRELKRTKPDGDGELQLTDAIRNLIRNGGRVYAVSLLPSETRIDIGTPQSYWSAMSKARNRRS